MTTTSTPATIAELQNILRNLDSHLADIRQQKERAVVDRATGEQDLRDLAGKKADFSAQISKHQETIGNALQPVLTMKERELDAASGTSLEKELQAACRAIKKEIGEHQAQMTDLTRRLDDIESSEQMTLEELKVTSKTLDDLGSKERQLLGTRSTFDERHAAAVVEHCRALLESQRSALTQAERMLSFAVNAFQATQQECAEQLASWPALAVDFLVEHGQFLVESPEVEALRLRSQLNELVERHAPGLSEQTVTLINVQIPVKDIIQEENRLTYELHQEASYERLKRSFGERNVTPDQKYHNVRYEQFIRFANTVQAQLSQAELSAKREQAKALLEREHD